MFVNAYAHHNTVIRKSIIQSKCEIRINPIFDINAMDVVPFPKLCGRQSMS